MSQQHIIKHSSSNCVCTLKVSGKVTNKPTSALQKLGTSQFADRDLKKSHLHYSYDQIPIFC